MAADDFVLGINKKGGKAFSFSADLTRTQEMIALCEYAWSSMGRVDVLVNNAGMTQIQYWNKIDSKSIDTSFKINLRAPLLLSKMVAEKMEERKIKGSIINISSSNARLPAEGGIVYSAMKAALEAVTRGLALELGPLGIRVNAVAPGLIGTERRMKMMKPGDEEDVVEATPLGRLGTPADVARVVAFLASDDAAWISGHVISANGGLGL